MYIDSVSTETFIEKFENDLTRKKIQIIDMGEYVRIMQIITQSEISITVLGERGSNFALAIEDPGIEIKEYPGKRFFIFYQR